MSHAHDRIHRASGKQHEVSSRRGFLGKVIGAVAGWGLFLWVCSVLGYMSPRKAAGKKEPRRVSLEDIRRAAENAKAGHLYLFEWGADVGGICLQPGADGRPVPRAFNVTCTHLGCTVKWVPERQLFICPCHEGRFDKDGKVVYGVPPLDLEELKVQAEGDFVIVGGA